jgi:hypothetical protein
MRNLYRGLSIDDSYQVLVHLAWKSANQKHELPVMAMPFIDTSYQVSVHLAERFQRRWLKCEKLADDGHRVMAKDHIAFGKVN